MRNHQLLLESQECVKQIGYDHLREEKLSFKNNYIEHYFYIRNYQLLEKKLSFKNNYIEHYFYIMRNYQLLLESHECVKQIGYGHQCLREEKLSFKNNFIYIILYHTKLPTSS